ncbi:MAG: hypothetical protein JW941_07555 [Candidatus Coatesbacteria bacterium]|nr:hypothetical protein [Candidatus Coatesbacteria bacterium]
MSIRTDYIICGVLVAFWAIGNIVWLSLDNSPPVWDPAFHITDAIVASESIASMEFGRLLSLQGGSTFYPPLWHIVAGIFILIFGRTADAAMVSNLIFLPPLVFGVYYIGRRLFNRRAGPPIIRLTVFERSSWFGFMFFEGIVV